MSKKELPPDLKVLSIKEIKEFTGLCEKQCGRLLKQTREYYKKRKRAKVVVTEFCYVTGYTAQAIYNYFGWQ